MLETSNDFVDKNSFDQKIIENAVSLSLIEVGIGSFVHAFKIPFGGHLLSLNQALYLIRFSKKLKSRLIVLKGCFEISMIVAIMKSLSPAGRKLGPMLSIGMQGVLFSMGITIAGNNRVGRILGLCLLSVWAFIQPFISYYLIYGHELVEALDYFISKLNTISFLTQFNVLEIFMFLLIVKILIGFLLLLIVSYIPNDTISKFEEKITNKENTVIKKYRKTNNAVLGALIDLVNPFFLISIGFMILFFTITKQESVTIIWMIFRAISIGFIIFYLARAKWFFEFMMNISRRNKYIERLFTMTQKAYSLILED